MILLNGAWKNAQNLNSKILKSLKIQVFLSKMKLTMVLVETDFYLSLVSVSQEKVTYILIRVWRTWETGMLLAWNSCINLTIIYCPIKLFYLRQ